MKLFRLIDRLLWRSPP